MKEQEQRRISTLCVANRTRPKEPVPKVTPTSKSAKVIGVGRVRTASAIYQLSPGVMKLILAKLLKIILESAISRPQNKRSVRE